MTRAGQREVVVCALADLPPGERREAEGAAGHGVTVFNVGGELHALLNHCPHRGGPLCRGRVGPLARSTRVGFWTFEREGEILRCPYHNWEFDLKTGRALYDDRLRARRYPVTVRGGQVTIHLSRPNRRFPAPK